MLSIINYYKKILPSPLLLTWVVYTPKKGECIKLKIVKGSLVLFTSTITVTLKI